MDNFDWDAAIIGGGSAGLSAALMLVRARRRVLVIDGGLPRNRVSAHMHGVLGHDGRPPLDLVADGRREVESYGGVIRATEVVRATATDGGFEVENSDGSVVTARRLLVATGLRDELPAIEGLAALWGRGVAMCPYCDGYEARDGSIGVIATNPGSVFQAQLLRQWSPTITYFTEGFAPTSDELLGLEARGITVITTRLARVTDTESRLTSAELADGRMIPLDAIFTAPLPVPLDEPLRQLGAQREDQPRGSFVQVDAMGATSVSGVWAAGNVVNQAANVAVSIGAAAIAAGALNHDLMMEDVRIALANR